MMYRDIDFFVFILLGVQNLLHLWFDVSIWFKEILALYFLKYFFIPFSLSVTLVKNMLKILKEYLKTSGYMYMCNWFTLLYTAAAAKLLQLCPTLCDHQAPLSLGFSRQEHRSGLPFPSPMHESEKWKWSRSVLSDFSWPHGLQPTRLLRPWDFPGKSTGVGWHCLLWLCCIPECNKTLWIHLYSNKS